MAEDNRRAVAPRVKAEVPADAPIERGKLYFRQQILVNLGIDKHTFNRWKAGGLKTHQPGTRAEFVIGDELIDWIASDAELPAAYESPHAERNARRRKQE